MNGDDCPLLGACDHVNLTFDLYHPQVSKIGDNLNTTFFMDGEANG